MPKKTTGFEHLLEAVPDALVGMDQEGVIRFVNRQTEALFGYDRDELIGASIQTLVPEVLYEIYAEHREDYFTDPRTRSSGLDLVVTGRKRDGTVVPVNISMSNIDTGDVLLVITAVREVTQQRLAVKNAELTSAIVECSDDAITGTTLEGTIISWNPAAEAMYGYSVNEIIGRSGGLLIPDDRAGEMETALARVTAGEPVGHIETNRVRKDGTVFPVSISVAPIRDENGAVAGASSIARDMTERRRAFEAAQRMAAIVESSDDAIIGSTLDGIMTSWNPAAEVMFGYSAEEMIGRSGRILTPKSRIGEIRTILDKVRAGKPIEHLETVRVRKDGQVFPVLLTVSPIRDANGEIVGASAISRNMTELTHAARYTRGLIEASPDALVTIGPQGWINDVNEAVVEITGVPRDELIGSDFAQYLTDPDKADEAFQEAFVQGAVRDVPLTVRRTDGKLTDMRCNASVYRDVNGDVLGILATAHDVTRQKKALETALRMTAIVESSRDAIISGSLDGIITSWNPAAEAMYGFSSEEIVGRSIELVIPGDRIGDVSTILAGINAGEAVENLETVRTRKDGSVFPVSITVSPIRDSDGAVVGTSAIHHDLTAHLLRLQALQRIAAIVESSDDAIFGTTLDGTITSWNQAAEGMFGFSSEEMIGRSAGLLIPEGRAAVAEKVGAEVLAGRPVRHFESVISCKDGTTFQVSLTAAPIFGPDGSVIGGSTICRDLTEQENAAHYARSLIESAMDPLMMVGLDGRINDLNEAAVKISGVAREDLVGSDFTQYVTEPGKAGEVFKRVLEQGGVANVPLTVRHLNGTLTRALCNASAYRDSAGSVLGMLAIARDVTEHMRKDEAVERLASMVEFSGEAIIGTTLDGIVTTWNPAAMRMHGYSGEEIVGKSVGLLVPEDRTAEVGTILARINAGQVLENFETMRLRKDGTMFRASVTITPIRDPDGAIVGTTAIGRELTAPT